MTKVLHIELDDTIADLLADNAHEINEAFKADWTPETLAASYIVHVLLDDVEIEITTKH